MVHLPVELQSLVDIHDQPFLIVDDNHRVVVVNKAFEEAYGVKTASAQGRSCQQLIASHNCPSPCSLESDPCPFADTFTKQVTRSTTHTSWDAEGREHLVRIHAYPIRTQDGRVYLGKLIQRDAIRHHPGGADAACPRAQMVGNAPAYREAVDRLLMAANSEVPVLLQGETGTGKELAAAFIHRNSGRRDGPFETLDCTVLTAELFESEVFGHERGAFTGSVGEKVGLFELADKGTLFLDEIGELPLPLQAKLLRLLETGEFRRVGGTRARRADVRLVCATNRELQGASWFRSDLFYRVACITVRLPSLAERRSDIPLLAKEILERISESSGRRTSIDPAAVRLLQAYDFPGNIRELRNILWVAAVNSTKGHICPDQLALAMPQANGRRQEAVPRDQPEASPTGNGSRQRIRRPHIVWDRDHLADLLRLHEGNRRAVAQDLGVSERTVYRKLRELGLHCLALWVPFHIIDLVTRLDALITGT